MSGSGVITDQQAVQLVDGLQGALARIEAIAPLLTKRSDLTDAGEHVNRIGVALSELDVRNPSPSDAARYREIRSRAEAFVRPIEHENAMTRNDSRSRRSQ